MDNQTAKEILDDMVDKTYVIDGLEETIESWRFGDNDKVIITTDKETHTYPLHTFGATVRGFKRVGSTAVAVQDSSAQALDFLAQDPGIASMQDALLETLKKLRSGDTAAIPLAHAINSTCNTLINVQKNKIEMFKIVKEIKKLG